MSKKAYVIILLILLLILGALGLFSAIKNYGYIALVSGLLCGKISTHLFFHIKQIRSKPSMKK